MSTLTLDAAEYRFNQVREWQSEIKTAINLYSLKVQKYKRRIVALDVIVYSLYATVASAGVILSAITPVTAVVAATICISTATTTAGDFSIIAKINSSRTNKKLRDYEILLNSATVAYQKLPSLISSSLDPRSSDAGLISDSEFKTMSCVYNNYLITTDNNNVNGIIPTNSHKHNTGKKHNDISVLD